MNLKNIFKKRPSRYQVLVDKINDLEKRTFNEKKEEGLFSTFYSMSWFSGYKYEPIPLEEEISILQDKLDVLAKHLKVSFEETKEKEKEWTVKSLKKKK